MSDEIKAGDVVQLKSGGPRMTVSQVSRLGGYRDDGNLHVWCNWFVQDKAPWKKGEGVYPLTSVRKIE